MVLKSFALENIVVSRQSSHHLACAVSHHAYDILLTLVSPHLDPSSPLLTRLAWNVLIPSRAAVCQERQLLARRIQGSQNGLQGAVLGSWQ
jgi:hypothetical protein